MVVGGDAVRAAWSYAVPAPRGGGLGGFLSSWGVDTYFTARTAPPVDITGTTFSGGGVQFAPRPNLLPNVPLYLNGPQYPGGKAFNKAAFATPLSGTQGNFGRNVLRGFGAWQQDLALRRQFHLTERLHLQLRAEFFNIFNPPNFGAPTSSLISATFGQS